MLTLKNVNMQKIRDSGQCFRIKNLDIDKYFVPSGEKACICIQKGSDINVIADPEDYNYWRYYFNETYNYSDLENRMNNCMFLSDISSFGSGIRRLNQDPWECLVSFIISQRKSVKAISTCIEKLCNLYGKRCLSFGVEWYSFPTAEKLKDVYESEGYEVGMGYRDEYVYSACLFLLRKKSLNYIATFSYCDAKKELKKLYGVGDKIADCVLLYSLGFNQAFPVDVWISRYIANNDYFKDVNNLFRSEIGIVQLYIYYYMRNYKG